LLGPIAQLFLKEEDSVQAESYLNRAASLVHSVNDRNLQLDFQECFARIEDYKREFIKASRRYYDLSQQLPDHSKRDCALRSAVICAILAALGVTRLKPENLKPRVTLQQLERDVSTAKELAK